MNQMDKHKTIQNYKATSTSLLTNEKTTSTLPRQLFCPNRPVARALPTRILEFVFMAKNIH